MTNHLYEFAKSDLECYLPKLKPGGYLTGDDYVAGGSPYLLRAGVKRAVDEMIASGRVMPQPFRSSQFILRKPD